MAVFIFFTFLIYCQNSVRIKKTNKKTHKTQNDFIISLCSETLLHQKKYVMDPLHSYIFNSEVMYLPYFMGMENGGREEIEGKERQEHVL